jgi:hypothetical protein
MNEMIGDCAMRRSDGCLVLLLGLLVAGCAGSLRTDSGVVPGNAYITEDIEAARASDANDLRDKRPIEPGRTGITFGGGVRAPSDYLAR